MLRVQESALITREPGLRGLIESIWGSYLSVSSPGFTFTL